MLHSIHPLTFAAMLEHNTPKFSKAMNSPMVDNFIEIEAEMEMLEASMDPWEVFP